MSDLDADLYGDLYENDFNEEDVVNEPPKTEPTTVPKAVETKPATPPPLETKIAPVPTIQAPLTPSIAPPVTQSIPTYEEPTTQYREPHTSGGGSYDGNGYQSISVAERSVRPSEMKDEGKMFIGGLNWDTTDESLRNYFTQFGKVDACTIMRDPTGRSRCFAFLTFEEPASVNAVMVREHFLDGKIIDPKRAIPRQEHQRATKLFIGGLAGSVTSESMREFFSQFGKVIDSTVMLDRETGRSKGFGFISFEDADVTEILGFGKLQIDGKLIDIKLAQPRYQRDQFETEGGGPATSGDFHGGGASGFVPQGNFNATSNTPYDPQALAALYTRMFQMTNNQMGMMGAGGAAGAMGGMPMGAMAMGRGIGGMSGGRMGMGVMGSRGGSIPRGPRGAPTGPAAGPGPQRAAQRGQHNYHPYAR